MKMPCEILDLRNIGPSTLITVKVFGGLSVKKSLLEKNEHFQIYEIHEKKS